MPVYPSVALAPGDPGYQITEDMQYEFRGVLFGHGTEIQVETMEGLFGMPSARTNDDENQEDHGDHAGVDLSPGRTLTGKLNCLGGWGQGTQTLLDLLSEAFQSSKREAFMEYPFATQRPGHDVRFVYARPRRSEFPSDYALARGKGVGAIQVYATDPRWYSAVEQVQTLVLPNAGATITADVESYGDFKDGSMPLIEIDGPCTNPRVANLDDDGKTIRLDVVVPVGQTLLIDTKRRTVFLNGVDRFDTVRADNQWWVILPGINSIKYDRSAGGVASNLRLKFRAAWTSA